jgi:hypothetical protein
MACEHKHLRCTDGVFYCLDCGAKVDTPVTSESATGAKAAVTEPPKRRAKKGAKAE